MDAVGAAFQLFSYIYLLFIYRYDINVELKPCFSLSLFFHILKPTIIITAVTNSWGWNKWKVAQYVT